MKDKLFDQLPEDQKFEELSFENLEYVNDNLDDEEIIVSYSMIWAHI
jgi:hypothetical protein